MGRVKRAILYRLYLSLIRYESLRLVEMRRWLFDQILGRRHRNLLLHTGVFIEDLYGLRLGDDVSINRNCNLSCGGGLTIGNYVSIAHATTILTSEHGFADKSAPIKYQPVELKPVVIGDNVWIGAQVCILAGVSLAEGTIVGAGSLVKHSVTVKNCTIAGVPAKVIKRRG